MINIPWTVASEVLDKASRFTCKEVVPLYIVAAMLDEAGANPHDVVSYLEEKYLAHIT